MGLQFPHALPVLLLLFPVFPKNTKASEEGNSSHSSSTTASLLFCLLLFLLVLLFLALRKLSRDSEGRYNPRRLAAALIHRWQALRGEPPPEELPQSSQDEEQRMEELEELEQQQDMEAEEQLQQEDNQEEEENREDLNENINSEPPEEAEIQHHCKEEGAKAAEGSAEALLSDLHSFSGTAAWEDSGKHFHITTL
uniref:Uncharacterized protein n=1 Tax=Sphaerodactylus townsendi TaxID=933632 RepID=A0ACB8G2J7_9SAUR